MKSKNHSDVENASKARPLLVKEWSESIGIRKAVGTSRKFEIRVGKLMLPKEYRGKTTIKTDPRTGTITVLTKSSQVGKHFFPPDIKSVKLTRQMLKGV